MNITFKVINFKKYIFPLFLILFVLLLIIFSDSALIASKNAIKLWAINIVPSLFPFFVATEALGKTNVFVKIGQKLNKPIKKIFNVPRHCFIPNNYGSNFRISYWPEKLFLI